MSGLLANWREHGITRVWFGDRVVWPEEAQFHGAWPKDADCPLGWDEREAKI